jgi:N-acetylglucosamine-6-phosphate deacetylase
VRLALEALVLRSGRLAPGRVAVAGGRVIASRGRAAALPPGWIVAPGLVDLQVNGYAGAEVGDDPGAVAAVAARLPRAGVTAFCPTLVSRSDRGYARAAAALARAPWPAAGAAPLGVHLEGPFLAPTRAGAHPAGRLRAPAAASVDRLAAAFAPRIVTLAPELPGGVEAVRRLSRAGVLVALGHTEADHATALRAFAAGARMLTHAANAMRGIEHRAPSALVAALGHRRAAVSLIADGVHVAPPVAALLARLAGRRLVLVSDATAATEAPPGRYRLGERMVSWDGAVATVAGRLAGGCAGLARGPAVLAGAGVAPARALAAACEAPRRLLGLPLGLRPGDAADLVILDPDLVPRLTLVGGRVAHLDPDFPLPVPGEPPQP